MRAALVLMVLAAPAVAQTYAPPAGCEVVLTVQGKSCLVRHVMRCADNPQGSNVALVGAAGLESLTSFDAGTMSLQSMDMDTGHTFTTGPVADPFDIIAAAQLGRDTFEFEVSSNAGDQNVHYLGEVRRDGEPVSIGGRDLWPLSIDRTLTWVDSGEVQVQRLVMLFDPALRVAYSATLDNVQPPGEALDRSPVSFALPGEPGFLSMVPVHDCAF